MTREQLAHILRAACRIVDDPAIVVLGSQAILGAYPEESLPRPVTMSVEADLAFFGDDDHHKSDMIDAMIGEESQFHRTFAYYGQGVSLGTAVLGPGWQGRLVRFDDPASAPAEARCLDPHDLVLAKLAAHREKDLDFCWELAQAGLVDTSVLRERLPDLPVSEALAVRIASWIDAVEASRHHA